MKLVLDRKNVKSLFITHWNIQQRYCPMMICTNKFSVLWHLKQR